MLTKSKSVQYTWIKKIEYARNRKTFHTVSGQLILINGTEKFRTLFPITKKDVSPFNQNEINQRKFDFFNIRLTFLFSRRTTHQCVQLTLIYFIDEGTPFRHHSTVNLQQQIINLISTANNQNAKIYPISHVIFAMAKEYF